MFNFGVQGVKGHGHARPKQVTEMHLGETSNEF